MTEIFKKPHFYLKPKIFKKPHFYLKPKIHKKKVIPEDP